MSDSAPVAAETAVPAGLSPATIRLFALACGATVANIYYAQSLVGPIAQDLDMPANLSGLVVTITQIGYGAGLFLIVCLGDLLENRRLILTTTAAMIASLAGLVASRSTMPFLVFSFVLGMAAVGTQVLVPLAAHLSSEASRSPRHASSGARRDRSRCGGAGESGAEPACGLHPEQRSAGPGQCHLYDGRVPVRRRRFDPGLAQLRRWRLVDHDPDWDRALRRCDDPVRDRKTGALIERRAHDGHRVQT
ncbi:MFS transporter [Acidomonas methanolica]|uniref:MFS transporter n=1 Tax=Acidomonas methanolica TaxID=437 RepID=UPI0019552558|nr:MFS transporter [Acidomonas methanolica]MBU2655399.1 hypothetical protein [Acidomonas methanolica]